MYSLSDGVRAFLAFLLFQMVLNKVTSFPHLINVYKDDLSVNLNKLQIGCLYAGILINHLIYADDHCIFSPLRKHTNCCAMYGIFLNIIYNADKSYCMVINSKSHDMKNIHCVNLNNQFYTIKWKYLRHIINNNLTDVEDIAR